MDTFLPNTYDEAKTSKANFSILVYPGFDRSAKSVKKELTYVGPFLREETSCRKNEEKFWQM
jgi:hypothetical protein